jgi:hypothetical protein
VSRWRASTSARPAAPSHGSVFSQTQRSAPFAPPRPNHLRPSARCTPF